MLASRHITLKSHPTGPAIFAMRRLFSHHSRIGEILRAVIRVEQHQRWLDSQGREESYRHHQHDDGPRRGLAIPPSERCLADSVEGEGEADRGRDHEIELSVVEKPMRKTGQTVK